MSEESRAALLCDLGQSIKDLWRCSIGVPSSQVLLRVLLVTVRLELTREGTFNPA
jgi:hypothetical protein